MVWWIIGIFWLVCSLISLGYSFAYFHRTYRTIADSAMNSNRMVCVVAAVFGPFAMFSALGCLRPSKGWLWPFLSRERLLKDIGEPYGWLADITSPIEKP